ncbi:phosphotransferase family protein [Rhodococcus sp. 4CII]|uniref:phosphotransferase family protein n=2 Tax=unclassified Rhodococcus (in: high G+C Gram-positive bacteria) TaxID=192944 RepID=UPI00163AB81C|nr:phosphotransferase family protein [Rhodococcus sp. 4CII]MBC2637639.1 phosphotransferase family protein [Rhodococcus sp. 3A]MBC2897617.1 phosphotransferase family protein [Rhodococcus sp. 4CII]
MTEAERDRPSPETIQWLRSTFPTEAEYARVLDSKLTSRDGGEERPETDLSAIGAMLERFVGRTTHGAFSIDRVRWLSGGGSKMQVAFDLDTSGDGSIEAGHHRLVLRLEPLESLNATSRVREAQIITALRDVVPVPRVYWIDESNDAFGRPALIYSFVDGVTKPRGTTSHVGGVGGLYTGKLRTRLADQFVDDIARIHTVDVDGVDTPLDAFSRPRVGSPESALWQVNRARRIWEEDRRTDLPFMEVAANWLIDNAPPLDRISVIHGDYRTGNFLFDENSGDITAWLDWERSYLGDRHRDLAWIMLRQWGNRSQSGDLMVSGLIPEEEFLSRYSEASGMEVDPARLRYYKMMNLYQLVASSLGTAYRVSHLGRSHQDVLLTWIEGLAHAFARDLVDELSQVRSAAR